MPIQTKPPAHKRPVHVLKLPEPPLAPGFNPLGHVMLPEPPLAPGFNPLVSEEATNAFFQQVINATLTGM